MRKRLPVAGVLLAVIVIGAGRANAETPAAISGVYEAAARAAAPGFAGFSAQRGEQLFQSTHGGDWSCASCHTANPLAPGKHAKTAKPIAPLAPAANAERFTSLATAEKWFKRNCNDATAVDGPLRTVCLGWVTARTCYRSRGGPEMRCDEIKL